MKLFCRREVQGAISIFLVAIMLPIMIISALMVDTARYQLAKSMVSSAGDLAMNAALADYDTVLKDVYGLFAMSQVDDVERNVRNYFIETVISYGVVGREEAGDYVQELLGMVYEYLLVEGKETADFLPMAIKDSDIRVDKIENSSLTNPGILEKQIVEYMKYRAPVGFGMSFLDSLSAFTKVEKQTDVIQAQVNAQYTLEKAANADAALYAAIRDYDKKYEELEPDPPTGNRVHLKNYGHIFEEEYVEDYEKLHKLTLAFCVKAYMEKWNLPDTNRSDSGFVILNQTGSYIVNEEGKLSVSGHMADSNTSFGTASSDPLDRYLKPFWNNDKANVVNTLNGYGNTARITIAPESVADETNWEVAKTEFKQVDDFYRDNYGNYAAALKKLDEYAAAMEAYVGKIEAEIQELEVKRKAAEEAARNAGEKSDELLKKDGEASARLDQYTEEEKQAGQDFLDNKEKLEELRNLAGTEATEALAEITALEQRNQEISDQLGEKLSQITQDLDFCASYTEKSGKLAEERGEAQANQKNYENQIKEKNEQLVEQKRQYQEVLASCKDAVNSFNQDAINYKKMKTEVKTFITTKAVAISGEYKLLEENVKSLNRLLEMVETKYQEAQSAIDAYAADVETWSKENDSYQDAGGQDSFSDVQSSDIKEANKVFSIEEVRELLQKIQPEHEKVSAFLAELDANFTYMGGPKIKDITNAEQIADAICARSDRGFDLSHNIDRDRLNMLQMLVKPVPCCSFLNYLHQTYKDSYGKTEEQIKVAATEDQKKDRSTYDTIKESNKITEAIEKEKIAQESGENKFGYTYGDGSFSSSKKADKDGLASSKNESKDLLQGLVGAMETGRDKLYVMEYLFEYFSYNTIVQDLAREGGKKPSWFNSGAAVYKDFLDKPSTGSHVPINGINNRNYGAEIEYVLFGNEENAVANVTLAYGSIFAVRVLFNSVYAFTSSDIRSQTRALAMSVQIASAGIIPYQLVQVVMQLALAMAESAVDLKNMEAGAKVAVVKSKDTWTLSVQGVSELAKGTIKTVMGNATEKAAQMALNKINEIVDVSAEKLSGMVGNVEKDLTQMANSAAENLLDSVFSQINSLVDAEMSKAVNAIFYPPGGSPLMEGTEIKREAVAQTKIAFEYIKKEINMLMDDLAAKNSDNVLLSEACKAGGELAGQALDEVYGELVEKLNTVPIDTASISAVVYEQIYSVKAKIDTKVKDAMGGMISRVSGKIQTEINSAAGEIKNSAKEGTEEAKEKITKSINDFVDSKLSFGTTKLDTGSESSLSQASGNSTKDSSRACAITFGYSDYLRLFVFLGLCSSDKSGNMIRRIGNLIETNISSAGEGSELHHRRGSQFAMADAKTYVSISADVELEMMFLRLGIFQRQIESWNEEYEEEQKVNLGETMEVHYLGISGY